MASLRVWEWLTSFGGRTTKLPYEAEYVGISLEKVTPADQAIFDHLRTAIQNSKKTIFIATEGYLHPVWWKEIRERPKEKKILIGTPEALDLDQRILDWIRQRRPPKSSINYVYSGSRDPGSPEDKVLDSVTTYLKKQNPSSHRPKIVLSGFLEDPYRVWGFTKDYLENVDVYLWNPKEKEGIFLNKSSLKEPEEAALVASLLGEGPSYFPKRSTKLSLTKAWVTKEELGLKLLTPNLTINLGNFLKYLGRLGNLDPTNPPDDVLSSEEYLRFLAARVGTLAFPETNFGTLEATSKKAPGFSAFLRSLLGESKYLLRTFSDVGESFREEEEPQYSLTVYLVSTTKWKDRQTLPKPILDRLNRIIVSDRKWTNYVLNDVMPSVLELEDALRGIELEVPEETQESPPLEDEGTTPKIQEVPLFKWTDEYIL